MPPASGSTSRAPRSSATRSATIIDSGSSSPATSTPPGCTTSSFSCAIPASVGPSQRVCSRLTEVITCTREGMTLVAS